MLTTCCTVVISDKVGVQRWQGRKQVTKVWLLDLEKYRVSTSPEILSTIVRTMAKTIVGQRIAKKTL